MFRNKLGIALLVVLAVALTGCFNFGKKQPTLESITISVDGNVEEVIQGSSVTIKAVGKDSDGKTVEVSPSWSVEPNNLGTITAAGVFKASETEVGTVTIKAVQDDIVSNSITLKVVPDPAAEVELESIALSVDGDVEEVFQGNSVTIEAVGKDVDGNTVEVSPEWSVEPANLGTITSAGVFTASETEVGKVTIKATQGDVSATIELEVVADELASLELQTDYTKLIVGQSLDLQANATGVSGSPYPLAGAEWSLDDATVGELDADGSEAVFTATSLGTVRITLALEDEEESIEIQVIEPAIVAAKGADFVAASASIKQGNQDRNGYAKDVYFVGWDNTGTWVEWEIVVPDDADYVMALRYASNDEGNPVRSLAVRHPGEDLEDAYFTIDEIAFPRGGDFGRAGWLVYVLDDPIPLVSGTNIVYMENLEVEQGHQGMNVVWIAFVELEEGQKPIDDDDLMIHIVDEHLGITPVV